MDIQQHKPMHPGAFIRRVYLEPFNVGSHQLARQLKVKLGLVSKCKITMIFGWHV